MSPEMFVKNDEYIVHVHLNKSQNEATCYNVCF